MRLFAIFTRLFVNDSIFIVLIVLFILFRLYWLQIYKIYLISYHFSPFFFVFPQNLWFLAHF
jgi:hypothetical protein